MCAICFLDMENANLISTLSNPKEEEQMTLICYADTNIKDILYIFNKTNQGVTTTIQSSWKHTYIFEMLEENNSGEYICSVIARTLEATSSMYDLKVLGEYIKLIEQKHVQVHSKT